MSLKENKKINTIKTYNNKILKIKNNRNSNFLNNNNTISNNINNNNINLTAIEPIENIYEIYHQKNRKNKVEYNENIKFSLNKFQKLRNKKNILTNISLNTTTTFNNNNLNNNNNNIFSSLPFIQTSANSTFDFKTHTTTNTSFSKTSKKNFIPNKKKTIIENNKKTSELNYIYFPDNNKINPNDYYYTSTFSFPDLIFNKTKNKKKLFNKSLYEKLMFFDNLINTIKKRDIQTIGEYIINKTKFNNLNIKAPECVIHNVFLNLLVKDIFHKIEIRNEMNKFINYDYVVNLLNEEIYKFKKNIFDLNNFEESGNSNQTINTDLSNDYLNYVFKKNKINKEDENYYYDNIYDDVDDDFFGKNNLHSNILNINKFRLNKHKIKNFDDEITEENSKGETTKRTNNNETKTKQKKNINNENKDIMNFFNNNKLSNIFHSTKKIKKEDYAQTQYSNDSNYSKIHSKNFINSQKNFYIKDKNGNLISISDENYKFVKKNGELFLVTSSGKEILIDKNSSLISKDNKGNEIIISNDLNKNEEEINLLINNNIINEKNDDSNSSSYIEYINYDKDGKIIEKKRVKKTKKKRIKNKNGEIIFIDANKKLHHHHHKSHKKNHIRRIIKDENGNVIKILEPGEILDKNDLNEKYNILELNLSDERNDDSESYSYYTVSEDDNNNNNNNYNINNNNYNNNDNNINNINDNNKNNYNNNFNNNNYKNNISTPINKNKSNFQDSKKDNKKNRKGNNKNELLNEINISDDGNESFIDEEEEEIVFVKDENGKLIPKVIKKIIKKKITNNENNENEENYDKSGSKKKKTNHIKFLDENDNFSNNNNLTETKDENTLENTINNNNNSINNNTNNNRNNKNYNQQKNSENFIKQQLLKKENLQHQKEIEEYLNRKNRLNTTFPKKPSISKPNPIIIKKILEDAFKSKIIDLSKNKFLTDEQISEKFPIDSDLFKWWKENIYDVEQQNNNNKKTLTKSFNYAKIGTEKFKIYKGKDYFKRKKTNYTNNNENENEDFVTQEIYEQFKIWLKKQYQKLEEEKYKLGSLIKKNEFAKKKVDKTKKKEEENLNYEIDTIKEEKIEKKPYHKKKPQERKRNSLLVNDIDIGDDLNDSKTVSAEKEENEKKELDYSSNLRNLFEMIKKLKDLPEEEYSKQMNNLLDIQLDSLESFKKKKWEDRINNFKYDLHNYRNAQKTLYNIKGSLYYKSPVQIFSKTRTEKLSKLDSHFHFKFD